MVQIMRPIYVSEFFADEESSAHGQFGPEFLKETWPAALRVIEPKMPIFLIQNEGMVNFAFEALLSKFSDTDGCIVESGVYRITSFEHCTKAQVQTLQYICFYNGHLNVFFPLSGNNPHIDNLTKLWPKSVSCLWNSENNLGFRDWAGFSARLSRVINGARLFSFGHDGEPLYIFETIRPN